MINFPPLRFAWVQHLYSDADPHLVLKMSDVSLFQASSWRDVGEDNVSSYVRDVCDQRHALRNIITSMGIALYFLQHEKCPRVTRYRPRGTWAAPVLEEFVRTHIKKRQLSDFLRSNGHGKSWYACEFWHAYHAMIRSTLLREERGSNRYADAALYLNLEHPLVISFEVDRAANPERYGIEPQAQAVVAAATPPKRVVKKRRSNTLFFR